MQVWLKVLLIAVLIFSASSFIWFLLGSTAFFQRGMDIIGTTILVSIGVPVVLIIGLFISQLMKGWTPTNGVAYTGFFSGLIVLILLSTYLIQSVGTQWLNEKITSDSLKMTTDEKYEYRVDLINVFQRNSHARLYIRNIGTGEEIIIPIEIQTDKIVGLVIKKFNNWVFLEPTDVSSLYILYTTEELGIPKEKFEIDIIERISRRLE